MTDGDNYAAVLHGAYDIRVDKWPIPEIEENEVLVRMECVGICGSDLKLYSTAACGMDSLTGPVVMGHEGAGIVAKIGAKVTSLQVGDRVAVEPTQPCRVCEYCKTGRYNLCVAIQYCSINGAPGNLSKYYKHVADFCHKMPDNMSMEEGAALQPLAIAIHACARAGIKLGTTLVVLGAGPIGVLCAMAARAMGASKILMTDVVQSRLHTARSLVADHTVLVAREECEHELAESVVAALGEQPDVTIEACGRSSAQRVAMTITRSGGVVLVVGIGEDTVEVPLTQALLREVDIRGSYRVPASLGRSVERCDRSEEVDHSPHAACQDKGSSRAGQERPSYEDYYTCTTIVRLFLRTKCLQRHYFSTALFHTPATQYKSTYEHFAL